MTNMLWTKFPDGSIECVGLPWLAENLPELWRLPCHLASSLPNGVQKQLCFPADAKLCLRSDTSELHFRVKTVSGKPVHGLSVYVNGFFWHGVTIKEDGEIVLFAGVKREMRELTVYMPLRQEIQIIEYGMDIDAKCEPRIAKKDSPLVVYGSSVAQGVGSARAGMSYSAILCRSMNLDHVNLGFGGAGKAESEVVDLVSQVDACCYLLDLGKSYGLQSSAAYVALLNTLRKAHPSTPIICITPIFSSRELFNDQYIELSQHARNVVRESVSKFLSQGNDLITLVEGKSLLSQDDTDGLSNDGIHPSDYGHQLMAERLQPIVEDVLKGHS